MKRFLVWFLLGAVLIAVGGSVTGRFLCRNGSVEFDIESVRIEVINGCGAVRLARSVADDLQLRGFDVYDVGNAEQLYERTVVVDLRDPAGENARKIAAALAVQPRFWFVPIGDKLMPEVVVQLDSSRYLEVGVVLGEDYRFFFPEVVVLR